VRTIVVSCLLLSCNKLISRLASTSWDASTHQMYHCSLGSHRILMSSLIKLLTYKSISHTNLQLHSWLVRFKSFEAKLL